MKLATKHKLIALGCMATIFIFLASMNYAGYCLSAGRKLTDDEMFRVVIEHILREYPVNPMIVLGDRYVNGWTYIARADGLIHYKNVDEFLVINPDCCRLLKQLDDIAGEAGIMERVTGTVSGYIQVDYQLRYREHGMNQSVPVRFLSAISTCGRCTEGIDWRSSFQLFIGFNPADLFK